MIIEIQEKYKKSTCTNLPILLEEFEKLKGQFIITGSWTIERLVGIGTDEEDYYYLTYNGRKLSWHTCVGKLVQLKNKIDYKDYAELIRMAELNHYDQIKSMRNEHLKDLQKTSGSDDIIVGLYMELHPL